MRCGTLRATSPTRPHTHHDDLRCKFDRTDRCTVCFFIGSYPEYVAPAAMSDGGTPRVAAGHRRVRRKRTDRTPLVRHYGADPRLFAGIPPPPPPPPPTTSCMRTGVLHHYLDLATRHAGAGAGSPRALVVMFLHRMSKVCLRADCRVRKSGSGSAGQARFQPTADGPAFAVARSCRPRRPRPHPEDWCPEYAFAGRQLRRFTVDRSSCVHRLGLRLEVDGGVQSANSRILQTAFSSAAARRTPRIRFVPDPIRLRRHRQHHRGPCSTSRRRRTPTRRNASSPGRRTGSW